MVYRMVSAQMVYRIVTSETIQKIICYIEGDVVIF